MDRLVKEVIEICLHSNNINREEGFKLSHAWNAAMNIIQTSDTDNCINIGRGSQKEEKEKEQAKTSRQRTILRVKQQGTEPEVGEVTARVYSTLRLHTEPIRIRHRQD
jgi:hypothetical protein